MICVKNIKKLHLYLSLPIEFFSIILYNFPILIVVYFVKDNTSLIVWYFMNFSEKMINSVWEKGSVVSDFDPDSIRQDCCGAWIVKNEYGRQSDFGWGVDYIYPLSLGGADEIDNLRPMQWQNKESKRNDYPDYMSTVTSFGMSNIEKKEMHSVNENLQKQLNKLYGNI